MTDDPNDPHIRRRTAADMWPDHWTVRLWRWLRAALTKPKEHAP